MSFAPDARQLVLNVASWFTGGRPGRFLAYSTNFGLREPMLASFMVEAGHTWTVATDVPFTLDTPMKVLQVVNTVSQPGGYGS